MTPNDDLIATCSHALDLAETQLSHWLGCDPDDEETQAALEAVREAQGAICDARKGEDQ